MALFAMIGAEIRNTVTSLTAVLRVRPLPPPDASLSIFQSEVVEIAIGRETTYRLVISLGDPRPRWLSLRVELSHVLPSHPSGAFARLRKDLLLAGRAAHELVLHTDWLRSARVEIAGLEVSVDELNAVAEAELGSCHVTAVLIDREGREVERLVLRQRVTATAP